MQYLLLSVQHKSKKITSTHICLLKNIYNFAQNKQKARQIEFDKIEFKQNMNKSVYTKPTWEVFTYNSGLNILETLSTSSTTDDYDWGGDLGGDDDWVDADGEFL